MAYVFIAPQWLQKLFIQEDKIWIGYKKTKKRCKSRHQWKNGKDQVKEKWYDHMLTKHFVYNINVLQIGHNYAKLC
jgi:hypothetical protein